jgi:hypothetical protein
MLLFVYCDVLLKIEAMSLLIVKGVLQLALGPLVNIFRVGSAQVMIVFQYCLSESKRCTIVQYVIRS